MIDRAIMGTSSETSKSYSSKLSPHVVLGYEAPFFWHAVAIVFVSALYLNEYMLHHYLKIPHFAILFAAAACVAVHEVLRSCATCVSDVAMLAVRITLSAMRASAQHARRGFRPQFRDWSGSFHVLQTILKTVTTHHGHTIIWLHNAQSFRRNADWFGRVQGWLSCKIHGTMLESVTHNGLEHLWLRCNEDPTATKARAPIVLLYFHGGGYSSLSPHVYTDFCNRLCSHVRDRLKNSTHDLQVLIANYRKLPEVVYPTPVDDCMVMYEYLTLQKNVSPSNIILAGDSAGAGLVLSVLLRLRDAGEEMPLCAICSCPFVDFDGAEPVADHCIMHAPVPDILREFCKLAHPTDSEAWREAHIVDRDLSKLPPLLIQTGSFDIFHPHALRLAKKAENDSVVGLELDVHHEMPHVFSTFPAWLLPGSERGVEHMAAFIVKQIQRTGGGQE